MHSQRQASKMKMKNYYLFDGVILGSTLLLLPPVIACVCPFARRSQSDASKSTATVVYVHMNREEHDSSITTTTKTATSKMTTILEEAFPFCSYSESHK